MADIRFTTVNPDTPLLRDKQTGVVSVPLLVHDGEGQPTSITELLLDSVRAELLHASLSRALNGQDPKGRER
ncbi:hypothetical protein [Streptomyces sp. SID3343]|uniref:hypothetical protein n=1 Tax=Streptomyces sp. SID3343 TaxID=2690260 RepID=UPI001371CEB3|nr:hypothetical protein [Streptomyces sp. SID3343]MYV99064.1 hypothetical protein [Streptomyces sp. SID3343]